MIINTQIQVEDFKDYEENQSQLIGLKFECQDLVYDVNYSEFLDCPLDGLEIIFLNTLKRYSFGTKEIETKEGDVRSIPKDSDSIDVIMMKKGLYNIKVKDLKSSLKFETGERLIPVNKTDNIVKIFKATK